MRTSADRAWFRLAPAQAASAEHLGGEAARGQDGAMRGCHAFARTPRFVTALRDASCLLARHRQLMTARHAAAFRAEGHARCNRQGCATCGGRAGMARDVSRNGSSRLARLVPAIATLVRHV